MRLLYITNQISGPGGLERVLSVKTSILAEEYYYDVYILSLNDSNRPPFYSFSPKITFLSIQVGGNPLFYLRSYKKGIQQTVNDIQPDLISVCDDGLKGFFIPSIIKTNAKIIYERHASIHLNVQNSWKGRFVNYLMQRQVPKFDKFIVLTPSNCLEWDSTNVIAIPNPLSFESKSENPLDQKRIIVVGSHSWNKGYDLLLKIWKPLEVNHPDWRLDIFGKEDSDRIFIGMAKEMDLQRVYFHDPVKDIQNEYEQSSILILTSRSEGFGMVLIEAMECGVPCIAFDCPSGPGDIISNGQDGFLVPELDTHEFEKKLHTLMSDGKLRESFGKDAKRNAKRYTPYEIVKQWDQLFKHLVNALP